MSITEEFDPEAPRVMECDGIMADVQFNASRWRFEGRAVNTALPLTFSGKSVGELWEAFQTAVSVHREMSAAFGSRADKPYSGRYPLKMDSELHRRADFEARRRGVKLGQFIRIAIEKALR